MIDKLLLKLIHEQMKLIKKLSGFDTSLKDKKKIDYLTGRIDGLNDAIELTREAKIKKFVF
jgi:hypothetical protein